MRTKRNLAVLASAAMATVAATGLGATAAVASPMAHFSFPATEQGTMECDTRSYTFTGGEFLVVARDPSVAAHVIAHHVTAVDQEGTAYRAVGTETYSDTKGQLTAQISFIGPDAGKADGVNLVLRHAKDGVTVSVALDHGTCHYW